MISKPRLVDPDEVDEAIGIVSAAFGTGPSPSADLLAEGRAVIEPDRTFAVEDGGRLVGTAGAFTFGVALPGGAALPMAAITGAGVLPTHRRRGILSSIIAALEDHARELGEPLAGLTASEATIYRRFGYGVATRFHSLTIDAKRAAPLPDAAGGVAEPAAVGLVSEDEAATLLPAVWERHWRRTPGEVGRNPAWWRMLALDPPHQRSGASGRYVAVHEAGGEADGFVLYRLTPQWGGGGARFDLQIESVAAASPAVEAAVVRYTLGVDLVATVSWQVAPVDGPLRWQVADSRAVQTVAERDGLWLRPLDVAACLSARRYAAPGGLAVGVVDAARPDVGGTFLLDAGLDGAACARTDREPEVVVRLAELGSLLLGGVRWAVLRDAGLVDERAPGAVDRADGLFRTGRAPWCATDF
jgi:predicted acetyltransferase